MPIDQSLIVAGCPYCKAGLGEACTTPDGTPTRTHQARRRLVAGLQTHQVAHQVTRAALRGQITMPARATLQGILAGLVTGIGTGLVVHLLEGGDAGPDEGWILCRCRCGQDNRIPHDRIGEAARCGVCGQDLRTDRRQRPAPAPGEVLLCGHCGRRIDADGACACGG